MFEHKITYYEVAYFITSKDELTRGNSPLYGTAMPTDPNPASLDGNPSFLEEIDRLGREGWELVNVSPLLRGCYHEGAHYGYSLTAGYYFFWKKQKS